MIRNSALQFFYPMLFSGIIGETDSPNPINSDNLSAQISDSTDSLWQGLTVSSTMKLPTPDIPYTLLSLDDSVLR